MAIEHRALCIDLDGTLLRSDILYESLLALLAHNPLYLFLVPFWLLRGKAYVKRQLASRVQLPAETLPYDERVLEILRTTTQRPRVLCTASDRLLVQPIADHLGLFEEVMASDGHTNLSGNNKGAALAERFGERGFDYMGNGRVDLKVWAHAGGAIVVNNGTALARDAARQTEVLAHLPSQNGGLLTWVKALRVYQWLKNLLVLVPLLHGLLVAPLITLAGFALALLCSPAFAGVLLCYYVMTLSYSLKLKRIVMIDVVMLAALYTVRIIGGAVAINSELSFWLLAFSMFVFLSLAMLKRYTELASALANGKEMAIGRGYSVADLPLVQSLGAAAGYIGVLVFALYINSPESLELYRSPKLLWLLCPILLYWISRMWIVSHRGDMHDDPIVFAAMDRSSQIVIGLCVLIVLLAI